MQRVIDLQNEVRALDGHSLSLQRSAVSFSSTMQLLPTDRITDRAPLEVAELLVVVWLRVTLLDVKSADPDLALIDTTGAAAAVTMVARAATGAIFNAATGTFIGREGVVG